MGKRVVLALGGNAILQPEQEATYDNQYNNVITATEKMIEIRKAGHEIVVTHGNGPQVGNIIAQNEYAKDNVPALPIDVCSAESQGMIGYMMEMALKNHLNKDKINANVSTLLTMVEVDKDDKAFSNPSKPIGVFFDEDTAKSLEQDKGFTMGEDAGRGYRRLVPSPEPLVIHGVEEIKSLLSKSIIISSGGVGIPVYRNEEGNLEGVEAVIDKDRSGLKLSE